MPVRRYSVMLILTLSVALPWMAADPVRASETQMAETAERKAEILEQQASAEPNETPPAPRQALTPSGVQAVDPQGDAPLDDPITCLSRTIYWEARGVGASEMEAVAKFVKRHCAGRVMRRDCPALVDKIARAMVEGAEAETQGPERLPELFGQGARPGRCSTWASRRCRYSARCPGRPHTRTPGEAIGSGSAPAWCPGGRPWRALLAPGPREREAKIA